MTWESDDVLGASSYLQGIPPENIVLRLVAKKKIWCVNNAKGHVTV